MDSLCRLDVTWILVRNICWFPGFFYDFDIYDDILHVSKKSQKRQIFQTARINVLSLHVYDPPPPPLTLDPGTLAHRDHAHMLPALVEIFFFKSLGCIGSVWVQPYHHNLWTIFKMLVEASLLEIIMTVIKQ